MSQDPLVRLVELAGVRDAAVDARVAVDRLLGHRVLRQRSAAVSAESALRGARASAALEGEPVRLGDPAVADEATDPVSQGALRISAEIGRLVPVVQRAPRQAFARLHVLAAAGVVLPDRLGRPRIGPGDRLGAVGRVGPDPIGPDPLGLGAPVPASQVPARLDALADLLTGRTAAPALVVMAVVHGELLSLQAFGWGSGLVARAAARLVLVTRGVDPKAVSVPEVGHRELSVQYASAARGYRAGSPEGLAGWIQHCCAATALGAREGLAVCEAIRRSG